MIIGFTGRAGSGKSTAAAFAAEALGAERASFAFALKCMTRALLYYQHIDPAEADRMLAGDLKETPSPALAGRSPRHAMQTLGTEWGRDCMGRDFWVEILMQRISRMGARHVVIDDVRFENEAIAIWARGGHVFQIENPRMPPPGANAHASETQAIAAQRIENAGSLDDLKRAVQAALQGLD